jgi:TRAP-type mannitol/chloroaromatic compound transport system permease small subunit
MTPPPAPSPGTSSPTRRGLPDRIAAGWNLLVDGLGALGTVMIGALMCLICADVAARNITGASLPMVSEAGALTLVMIVYLQLATTIRHDRLARTELFFGGFKRRFPRWGAVLAAVYDGVACGALGVIAWATITIVQRDLSRGEYIGVPGIATLPTWPFRALILLGMTVATVQCALQLVRALRQAVTPPQEPRA